METAILRVITPSDYYFRSRAPLSLEYSPEISQEKKALRRKRAEAPGIFNVGRLSTWKVWLGVGALSGDDAEGTRYRKVEAVRICWEKGSWASCVRCVEMAVSFTGPGCLGLYCFDGQGKGKTISFDSASCIKDAYRLTAL